MAKASTTEVKKLLELAERMGLPAGEAINQVRELSAEPDPANRAVAAASGERPATA